VIADGDRTHLLVWQAVQYAVNNPCRLRVGQNDVLVSRIRSRLQDALDRGELPAGSWPVQIGIGSDVATIRVNVQADLFGPATIVVDVSDVERWIQRVTAEREDAWMLAQRRR